MNIAEKYQRQSSTSIGESFHSSQKVENQESPNSMSTIEVPTPAPQKKSHWSVCSIVVLLIVIIMAVTCPSQADHQEAVAKVFHEYVNSTIANMDNIDDSDAVVGSLFTNEIVDFAIKKFITADKYLIISIGSLNKLDGSKENISFGVFGHVFTFNKDQLEEKLSKIE